MTVRYPAFPARPLDHAEDLAVEHVRNETPQTFGALWEHCALLDRVYGSETYECCSVMQMFNTFTNWAAEFEAYCR